MSISRRPPSASSMTSPGLASKTGSDPDRSSTVQSPAGSLVERCSSSGRPEVSLSGDRRCECAGGIHDDEVSLVQVARELGEVGVLELAGGARGDEHPDGVAGHPSGFGRRRGLELGGQDEGAEIARYGRVHRSTGIRIGISEALYRPLVEISVDQGNDVGDDRVRQRPVGDVLAGKGELMHLGPEISGIDGPGSQPGVLGGDRRGGVVECGLGEPVPAPSFVMLDRGIGGDVQEPRVRRLPKHRCAVTEKGHRGEKVYLEDLSERLERITG